ncbi:MAG: sulfotransferase [Cyanobacteria bacterium J06621_11]
MTLPNFIIVGAQKAGTTWLAHMLRQHPGIFMPPQEVHFFNFKKNFNQGLGWYEQHFKGAKPSQIVGEKTPNYLWISSKDEHRQAGRKRHCADIHRNIAQTLPQVKLLVVVRNPVKRAISAINHYQRHGEMSPLWSIDDVLFGTKRHIAERYGVFDMGRYHHQLQAYYQCFDPNQIKVIVFEEEITREPERCLKNVCHFLGVDESFQFNRVQSKTNAFVSRRVGTALLTHIQPTKPLLTWAALKRPGIINRLDYLPFMGSRIQKQVPSDDVIAQLYDYYTEDNQKMFNMLGHSITEWVPS